MASCLTCTIVCTRQGCSQQVKERKRAILERALSSEDGDADRFPLMCFVKVGESGEVGEAESDLVHGVRTVRDEPMSKDLSPAIVRTTIKRCDMLAIIIKVCL